jgi:general secretion pathway protein C
MKRLPIVLSLVALILLAASIAYWVLQLYQPQQRPLAAAPLASMPDPSVDAAATLFGGQPSAAVVSNFQLTGIVAAGSDGDSVAILVADGAPPQALRVGKEVAPGVTVSEVHPRYVMLSDGGVMKRVDLATDTKPAAPLNAGAQGGATPMPMPEPQTAPGAVQMARPSDEAEPGEPPVAPGAVPPQGMATPGGAQTGASQSGGATPGAIQSGGVAPGAIQSGGVAPGAIQPGGVAPGSATPGNAAPGSATPGITTPGTQNPPPPAPVQMPPPTRSPGSPVTQPATSQ